ncbi:MAG: hypothetical protein HQL40_16990 [Alphaproteobacteria bacterium]|nr:hypothetical protein [Alphaproteobacteria bacterium]
MPKTSMMAGAALALVLAVTPAAAQQRGDQAVSQMADQLQALIEEARRNRSADPRFLEQLTQLAQSHSWPWRAAVLQETFQDGDFTRNPAWVVASGDFWVDRQLGLRTVVEPGRQTAQLPQGQGQGQQGAPGEVFGQVVGELLRRQLGDGQQQQQQQRQATAPARGGIGEIYTPQPFPNPFALRLRLAALSPSGRLEIGPYQGADRASGYRLAMVPDQGIEVLRMRPGGSAVIEQHAGATGLADGAAHDIAWTRDGEGKMAVSIDGRVVFTTLDRGLVQDFAGLTIVNGAGDWAIREVVLETVPR